ncbi:hypothetical protein Q4I28_001463 [Leishmania naiffi]|uniref:Uncharacterized protein n=1 Tax=Leishmania naiffi TaxID=5678 RepID=A0AAW3C6M3_9TRYP
MSNPEASKAAAEPSPMSFSARAPQERSPGEVVVPAPIQRFYSQFMALLIQQGRRGPAATAAPVWTPSAPSQHRSASTIDGQADSEDDALRRLTPVQEDMLGSLLWQWLTLFSLAVQPVGDTPRERSPGSSAMAVASAVRSMSPSHALGPHDVERLFHTGFFSLLPMAARGGGAGDFNGSRLPPADAPAPWHSAPLAEYEGPASALVAALSSLSRHGPLFSSWCALCYTCVGTSLAVDTSPGSWGKGQATMNRSKSRFSTAEAATRRALRRLRHAWSSAVVLLDAVTEDSSRPGTLSAQRSVDACATVQLWATTYTTCATSGSAVKALPIVEEKGSGTGEPQLPPLSLFLWAAQWYHECTRIAAHGADEGFHAEEAGVPVVLVARVMRYMCHRLEAEVVRCARQHDHTGTTERVAHLLTPSSSDPNVSIPFRMTLRIGALTALALQSPMRLVDYDTDRRGGAAKRSDGIKGSGLRRRRRRAWNVSADSNSDTDDSLGNPDCDGGGERIWCERTDAQSAVSRLILSHQKRFEVPIASGVLTTYSMCLADDKVAQPADHRYIPRLTGEQYLRNGTVHWWALSDLQRRRQPMAEAWKTPS